jgi:hypothetical protein
VGWNDTTRTVSSVTDSRGNTYSLAGNMTSGNGLRQSIYYAPNIRAGGNTVTVRFSGNAAFPDIRILEYSGVNVFDRFAGASGTAATANSGAGGNTTASSGNELIFGAATVSTQVTAPGTGFTTRVTTVPDGDNGEDRIVTANGNYNATAAVSQPGGSTRAWIMQMATFK